MVFLMLLCYPLHTRAERHEKTRERNLIVPNAATSEVRENEPANSLSEPEKLVYINSHGRVDQSQPFTGPLIALPFTILTAVSLLGN